VGWARLGEGACAAGRQPGPGGAAAGWEAEAGRGGPPGLLAGPPGWPRTSAAHQCGGRSSRQQAAPWGPGAGAGSCRSSRAASGARPLLVPLPGGSLIVARQQRLVAPGGWGVVWCRAVAATIAACMLGQQAGVAPCSVWLRARCVEVAASILLVYGSLIGAAAQEAQAPRYLLLRICA
jgi:hypothetical protein